MSVLIERIRREVLKVVLLPKAQSLILVHLLTVVVAERVEQIQFQLGHGPVRVLLVKFQIQFLREAPVLSFRNSSSSEKITIPA